MFPIHTKMCTRCISSPIMWILKRGVETCAAKAIGSKPPTNAEFETVFKLPHIRYIASFNRLKVYAATGTVATIPICGVLESLSLVPSHSTMVAAYVGVTSTALLSLVSLFTRNIIGFLYISTDNELVKISTVDYWGLRRDRVVRVEDWVPLSALPPRNTDPFYLVPQLESTKTNMKLILKLGQVLNMKKVEQLLE